MSDNEKKDVQKSFSDGTDELANIATPLSEAEIHETFDLLGLSNESKRQEIDNLKTLASGFDHEHASWISSHSIAHDEPDDRGE